MINKHVFLTTVLTVCIFTFNGEAADDTALNREAAKEAVRVASEVGKVLTVALTYISLAEELYFLGKATMSYLSPNEQEQAKAIQVNMDIKFLNSQQAFRSCVIQNRNSSQIDNSGIPTTCENAAYRLAMFAGQDEVERLTGIINKYKKTQTQN